MRAAEGAAWGAFRRIARARLIALLFALPPIVLLLACGNGPTPTGTPSSLVAPIPTLTPPHTPTPAATQTPTPTATPRPTATLVPTPQPSPTPTPAPWTWPTATPAPPRPTATPVPNAVRAIEALPWVLDGLTGDEPYYKRRLETYTWNPEYSEPLALAVVAKPWVQDGLTSVEAWTIGPIFSFVGTHHPPTAKSCAPDCEPLALRLLDMPFLETIDAIDARAANSLQSLLHYDYPSVHEILSHPTLRDGITDDLAPVVFVLSSVFSGKLWVPQSLDYLLDPEQTSPQERVITLPHTGTVKLVGIIPGKTASDAGVSRAMDILEYSVRTQEEFMGAPFPDPQLVMSIFDRGYSDGGYVRSHINSSTVDEYVIAHEVGHAYFGTIIGNWINEGGANFLETITRTSLHNTSLPKALDSCGTVKTIAEIISIGQNDRKFLAATTRWEKECFWTCIRT